MNTTVRQPVAVACLFTWIGFVCAISFMEAWLKFDAPGVTLAIGLGIGQLVFAALNKAEWVFAIAACISAVYDRRLFTLSNIFLVIVIIILAVQTIWVLPALSTRADQYIREQPVASSSLHRWFVSMELVKVLCLFITAISFFKHDGKEPAQH